MEVGKVLSGIIVIKNYKNLNAESIREILWWK